MASSPSNSTQRTEPPKYQLPYLQGSLGYAQDEYLRNQNGSGVAPLSAESNQALGGITNLATSGNTVNANASNLANQTLNGDFLGSNPYLEQASNRAGLQTQNQLASQFAGSGRNVDASMGLRAQQLNDINAQIYGGAYENERNRQQATLMASPQLGANQYADLNQLGQVGQSREGYNQELLNAPGNALDDYIRRISGNMGQTQIQTGSRNRGAGALGGALAGAQLGSAIFPGIGTAIGALGGGVLGGWG